MNLAMISDISDYTSEFTSSEQEETDDADDLDFFKCTKVKKDNIITISQFAAEIVQFSSQYGSDNSISYVADNMTGKPCKYPECGDFPEVYAMRTYSDWWEQTPSYKQGGQEYAIQNIPDVPVHDFVVIEFEYYVIPKEIRVYETYNPGALVRIWAYNITEHWEVLWEGQPEMCSPCARIFSPPLNATNWPTKTLRLEFNHSKLDYFTQIDACLLFGEKYEIDEAELNRFWAKSRSKSGAITKKLERVGFVPQIRDGVNQTEVIQEFFENGINSFIKTRGGESSIGGGPVSASASLNDLPYEIIFKILSYLDLKTVFRVSEVCKNLYCVATDPLLYTELNLKPFWNSASSALLTTLSTRCRLVRKLDLSWCGLFNSVNSRHFNEFIRECGANLTHIRLNTCKFLNGSCLEAIVATCPGLKELAIRNYLNGTPRDFHCLASLRHLERLDLFRTSIDASSLLSVLRNNANLKHLNLAFSPIALNMDQVALAIAQYNKQIVSIDMWKSKSLTAIGIYALSECHALEEVDFGWCLRDEASPGEALKQLLQNCPRMKKLFLASIRGLTDRDLENVALYCAELEQLDLMGILGISTEICYKILTKCKKLKMIDISFCQLLDNLQIDLWREMFDLSIKRSFLPSDLDAF